jgi:cobalt-zinc-cadmium efflux system outer membrane protein
MLRAATLRTGKVALAAAFFTFSAAALAGQGTSPLSLSDAIGRALEANRTILAARTARAIDLAGVQAAGQRPNPEVSFEVARDTPHWSFTGIVPLELSGKRQRRVDVANAALAVTEAETTRIAADVRADVRRAYYQAVGAVRRVAIAQELEAIQTRARDAAQDRFQTGAAPRLDALQASLALSQAQNEVAAARGDLNGARADLNALLAYPLDASPVLADPLDAGQLPTQEAATQQVLAGNAELQVLQKRIDEARARVALAKALRRPDPSVTASLTYDAPGEFVFGWRAGAAVALPIFTTGRPEIAVADATLVRAVADRDARVSQIAGAVSAALARATAARLAVERYQSEILPASLQVEQMAEESYRAGQTGLPAYLQVLQAARDIRRAALQAGLDYQLALADLERAMGTALK